MASVLTLYCTDTTASSSSAGTLSTTQPGNSTTGTGWTVGTSVPTLYSLQSYTLERAEATFGAGALPSGAPSTQSAADCWRLSAVTSGTFSAGTWYSSVSVIAVTSGGNQDGNATFRIWRSGNPAGTGATELTAGSMVGSRVTDLTTAVAQSSSASTFISTVTLTNEYLFLQVAWSIS